MVAALAVGATSCDWGASLPSDPAAWSPGPGPGENADAGEDTMDGSTADIACNGEPAFDPALQTSAQSGLSHRPGAPCLMGCHQPGGSAQTAFAAAGTLYRSQTSRAVAAAGGTVQSVGGTTLTLDRCGNFYAATSALRVAANQTQPVVQNPTLHQMDKPLAREKAPGDCNQGGCHDFSGKLKWGIYY